MNGHDKDRTTQNYDPVGQNFAMTASSANTVDMDVFVQLWYDEVKDFNTDHVKSFAPSGPKEDNYKPHTGVVGHYTQVVWAKTTKVGCGFIQFQWNFQGR